MADVGSRECRCRLITKAAKRETGDRRICIVDGIWGLWWGGLITVLELRAGFVDG